MVGGNVNGMGGGVGGNGKGGGNGMGGGVSGNGMGGGVGGNGIGMEGEWNAGMERQRFTCIR